MEVRKQDTNDNQVLVLGLLYTRSQGQKNLGPTLSIFGLQIGAKLLINARKLISGY
jgi:hypothetical protein